LIVSLGQQINLLGIVLQIRRQINPSRIVRSGRRTGVDFYIGDGDVNVDERP
jgi:hypothetical protein